MRRLLLTSLTGVLMPLPVVGADVVVQQHLPCSNESTHTRDRWSGGRVRTCVAGKWGWLLEETAGLGQSWVGEFMVV